MAAIVGKENVIWAVRYHELPYWKIFDNDTKKQAGNFVQRSKKDVDLSIEISTSDLTRALDMLQPGRYVFVASKKEDDKRGGIDTAIEIGVPTGRQDSSISGTQPAVAGFFMEGIGQITPENFEGAIEAKIKKIREEERRADELAALKTELAEMKSQRLQDDTVFRNGIMAIGTTVWPVVKKSPVVAELMGSIGSILNATGVAPEPVAHTSVSGSTNDDDDSVSDTDVQGQAERAIETLASGDPDFANKLEMLAELKKNNPDMYNQGIDFIKNMNE